MRKFGQKTRHSTRVRAAERERLATARWKHKECVIEDTVWRNKAACQKED